MGGGVQRTNEGSSALWRLKEAAKTEAAFDHCGLCNQPISDMRHLSLPVTSASARPRAGAVSFQRTTPTKLK
jgi:hypothetical protein